MLNTRFSPISAVLFDMQRMSEELDRNLSNKNGSHRSFGDTFPPVNMWESSEAIFVESELPGFDLDDVSVLVDHTTLTIEGERKAPADAGAWCRRERGYGSFERKVDLPAMADAESVEASLKNGILLLKVAKREEAKARRIEVSAG